eukprot:gene42020-66208_t
MATYLETSVQRDIDRIRTKVTEMGALAEVALQDCIKAVAEHDRQLAYAIILRDQYIDEKEKEIDANAVFAKLQSLKSDRRNDDEDD